MDYQQFFQKEENRYRLRSHSFKVFILTSEKSPEIVFQPQSLGQLEQITSDGCRCRYCADIQIKIQQIHPRCGKLKLISLSSHQPQVQVQLDISPMNGLICHF